MRSNIINNTIADTIADTIAVDVSTFRAATHNGMVTLHKPCGAHRTLRIHTVTVDSKGRPHGGLPEYFAGKRLVSVLEGPDRSLRGDWYHFGYCFEDAGVVVWRRLRGTEGGYFDKLAGQLNNLPARSPSPSARF